MSRPIVVIVGDDDALVTEALRGAVEETNIDICQCNSFTIVNCDCGRRCITTWVKTC